MPKPTKKAATNDAGKTVKQSADKVAQTAGDVFKKLKNHFEPKKVDEWQKKWLAMPEKRKQYEKALDAPQVVGEELIAMTNDIIDFVQGQEVGKSSLFKKIKGGFGDLFKRASTTIKQGTAGDGKATGQAKKATTKKVNKKK